MNMANVQLPTFNVERWALDVVSLGVIKRVGSQLFYMLNQRTKQTRTDGSYVDYT